jgi:acyl-CoA reductase-like NAD-dependent aldehyde dehydrogenase
MDEILQLSGIKDSGFGRKGVKYAIEDYTEPRLLVVNP